MTNRAIDEIKAKTKARQIVNAALDPWLNGDPCEDCAECERVCRKLQDRLVVAIAKALADLAKLEGRS